jgi:hypothetical protein
MSVEIEHIEVAPGNSDAIVTVSAPTKAETLDGVARQAAIQAARPHLAKCGFSSFGDWSYRNPAAKKPLTEAELTEVPSKLLPGGVYLQQLFIKACI